MNNLVEEIPLEDVNPDDEYIDDEVYAVEGTTGAVGGTLAETNFADG